MHPNHKLAKLQQTRIQKFRRQTTSETFFNLLTSETLLSKLEALLPEHRESRFPSTETLSLFLAQVWEGE